MHACMHVCMHGCMRAYMHAYMHLCMHAHMHARMYVRMYVRMHECIYTQIHTHKSTHIGIQARQAVAQHQVRSPPVRVEHPVFRGLFYRLIVLLQGLRTGGGHTFSHEPAVPGRCLVAALPSPSTVVSSTCAPPPQWILHLRTPSRAGKRAHTEPRAPRCRHPQLGACTPASQHDCSLYRRGNPCYCECRLLPCAPAACQRPIGDAAPARLTASPVPPRAERRQRLVATHGTARTASSPRRHRRERSQQHTSVIRAQRGASRLAAAHTHTRHRHRPLLPRIPRRIFPP